MYSQSKRYSTRMRHKSDSSDAIIRPPGIPGPFGEIEASHYRRHRHADTSPTMSARLAFEKSLLVVFCLLSYVSLANQELVALTYETYRPILLLYCSSPQRRHHAAEGRWYVAMRRVLFLFEPSQNDLILWVTPQSVVRTLRYQASHSSSSRSAATSTTSTGNSTPRRDGLKPSVTALSRF